MKERPLCSINWCKSLAGKMGKLKNGKIKYKKLCESHHRKKYGMKRRKNEKLKLYGETWNMDLSKCSICGWDKTGCDQHRLKYGCEDNEYVYGNVVSLCPNCHRMVHRGILKIG